MRGGVEAAANRPVFDPETVTGEGDVSITYNGNQIGVLSDSGTLTLDVKNTVCGDNIEVEYTKSGGSDVAINDITVVNSTTGDVSMLGTYLLKDNVVQLNNFFISPGTYNWKLLNDYNSDDSLYLIAVSVQANSDIYNVTVNGTPISAETVFHDVEYKFEDTNSNPISGNTYNIVITEK